MIRLGINIDHIATIRNARGELFPSVIEAALVAESNGADLITVHLREDRRHIKDQDVQLLRQTIKTQLNLEMAATPEMLEIALKIKPDFVCLVPEKRQELTTEGGLNVKGNFDYICHIIGQLKKSNILTSLFADADKTQIEAAKAAKAYAIEIHTGKYAIAKHEQHLTHEFERIKTMTKYAHSLGLVVNAGHGLNYHNVKPIAKLPHINELNIGFAIIAQSVFWGLPKAVSEMKRLMQDERQG